MRPRPLVPTEEIPVYPADLAKQTDDVLTQLLPDGAKAIYDHLVGGLFGDTLEDVVTHALIAFVHDRITTIDRFMPEFVQPLTKTHVKT